MIWWLFGYGEPRGCSDTAPLLKTAVDDRLSIPPTFKIPPKRCGLLVAN